MTERGYNIITRAIALVILLIAGLMLLVQIPSVQTRLVKKVTDKLEQSINGRLEYSDIRISPTGELLIKDLAIIDNNPYTEDEFNCGWTPRDTLFSARTISATFTLKGLLKSEGVHMGRVNVEHGGFHLVTQPGDPRPVSNIQRIFNLPGGQDKIAEPGPSIFDIRKFKVSDFSYSMNSFLPRKGEYSGVGIRYDDLDIHASEIRGHGMKFTGGKMYGTLDHCACTEKRGYELYELTGSCEVGLGRTLVKDIHLVDPWSDANIDFFSMTYRNAFAFRDFLHNITLESEIGKGRIAIETITNFSTALAGNGAVLQTEGGHFKGTVSDFQVDDLSFTDLTSGISGTVDGRLSGIPDVNAMEVDATLSDAHFTAKELKTLLKSVAGISVPALSTMAPGQRFTLDADVKGPLGSPKANIALNSTMGSLKADASIRNLLAKGKPMEIKAALNSRELNLAKLLGIDALGPVTLEGRGNVKLGKKLEAGLDSLSISKIQLLGKDFSGIGINGKYGKNDIQAHITSTDPKLRLSLDGTGHGSIADGTADFSLDGLIRHADLHALGIDTRGDSADAAMNLSASLHSTGKGNFESNALLGGIMVNDDRGSHPIPDIAATLSTVDGHSRLDADSEFFNCGFDADGNIQQLIAAVQNASTRRELPALYSSSNVQVDSSFTPFNARLALRDTRDVLDYFLPGLYISDGTTLDLKLDNGGNLAGSLNSKRLAYGTKYLKNAKLDLDNGGNALNVRLNGDELRAGAISMAQPSIDANANDNQFKVGVQFADMSATNGKGSIVVAGNLSRDEADSLIVVARPQKSFINVDDGTWVLGRSAITIRGKDIDISNFNIHNEEQSIVINGGISGSTSDTLNVNVNKLALSLVDSFLPKKYGFGGELNGSAYLISPTQKKLGMMLRMDATDVSIGGTDAGTFTLAGRWDEEEDRIKAYLSNELDGRNALMAIADYDPESKRLNANAKFDEMSPAIGLPFVSGIFSELGGKLDGELRARGALDSLALNSKDFRLDSLRITPVFTGVCYTLNGPVNVGGNSISLEGVTVTDPSNGRGTLNGTIRHNNLKDMALNASLRFRQMEVLDLDESDGMGFYGKLLASGNASISGPFNNLQVDATVTTAGDGDIHVPLNTALVGSTSDLLTFKEPAVEEDPYDQMVNRLHKASKNVSSSFSARAKVTATPGVTAFMELDKDSGNILSAFGSGTVELNLKPSKDIFTLNGDYNIAGGKLHVNLANVLDRELSIKNGGSIKFNGTLPDSELDVTAQYNLRTSLSTLVADTKSVSTRRNVEASLRIHDKLSSLSTDFDINIPDLDPVTKAQIESALNTEDKVQKQFVALLMLGSFIPGESSGVFNGSNALYSNVSSIVVGQLNSIMQKLEIPVGFGFDYQLNDSGKSIFDVAIGTQLFNNRVEVNGSLGNREYSTAGGQTSIVGDFDASLKLDKAGQFRLNAFSHSADEYTSFLDYSQRNGGGVSYQVDYDNFKDFINTLFRKRSTTAPGNRPENMQPAADSTGRRNGNFQRPSAGIRRNRNTVTIKIENEQQ